VRALAPNEISPMHAEDAPALATAYERNPEHPCPWDPGRPPAFSVKGQQIRITIEFETVARVQLAVWLTRCGDIVVRQGGPQQHRDRRVLLRPSATGSTARTRDEGSRPARWSTRARKR
jgi:hypothetical protein